MSQYESKFIELSRFASYLIRGEARKSKRFLKGLKKEIHDKLILLWLRTYSDIVERADHRVGRIETIALIIQGLIK